MGYAQKVTKLVNIEKCGPLLSSICDVIKQNESELANTAFKIKPNKAYSFFCVLLFVQSFNCLYLWNQFVGFSPN